MVHAMGYGFGLGFLNFLGTVLFFVMLIWVIRMFVRGGRWSNGWRSWRSSCRGHRRHVEDEALGAARERLARGEISAEEFAAIRESLSGSAAADAARTDERGFGERGFGEWMRQGRDRALELLRLRLARGEIDVEEYRRLEQALRA